MIGFIISVTILISLLKSVDCSLQSKYVTTKDFSLTLDLMDIFSGNNMEFTMTTIPQAQISEIPDKIRFQETVDLFNAQNEGIYPQFIVHSIKIHFPYIIGIYTNPSYVPPIPTSSSSEEPSASVHNFRGPMSSSNSGIDPRSVG